MKPLLLLCLGLGLLVGCAAEPFAPMPRPELGNIDPWQMTRDFDAAIPRRFVAEDTVIIHAPFETLAVLGLVRVDRDLSTFELLALNHMGVQLFMLTGDRLTTEVRYVIPPLAEQKKVLAAIAEDVRHMYLEWTPGDDAQMRRHAREAEFTWTRDGQTILYEFGGEMRVLLEKREPGWLGARWRVRYYDYRKVEAGLYPRGIVLDNEQYHYRIVVKNRSWQVEPSGDSQGE